MKNAKQLRLCAGHINLRCPDLAKDIQNAWSGFNEAYIALGSTWLTTFYTSTTYVDMVVRDKLGKVSFVKPAPGNYTSGVTSPKRLELSFICRLAMFTKSWYGT